MELVTSLSGSKAPRDGATLCMTLGLQSGNTLAQVLHTFQATRQTPTGKNTDLDLGPIQHGGSERCLFRRGELASS